MIREVNYRTSEFEIRFENPMPAELAESIAGLKTFFSRIAAVPGTRVLREADAILGLVFTYDGWRRLLAENPIPGIAPTVNAEFERFFQIRTRDPH